MQISLQKSDGKWLGTIHDGNKIITGVAINEETTASEKIDNFALAVTFIRATRPAYLDAKFLEIK